MPKIHHPSPDVGAQAIGMSMCGMPGSNTSANPSMVDCKLCERFLARAEKRMKTIDEERAEAARELVRKGLEQTVIPPSRWEEGLPSLTPDTYARVGRGDEGEGRCSCGHCSVCILYSDIEIEHAARAGQRGHGLRGDHRWTSVSAALEAYAILLVDGYSSGKSQSAAFAEIELLGYIISSGSTDPLRRSHHEAAELAVIDRTLRAAFAKEACGVTRAITILLLRVVGIEQTVAGRFRQVTQRAVIDEEEVAERAGMDPLDVRSIVRRGRRALTIELAAREWIPPPRESERAYGAYLQRADELEGTRVA